MASVSQIEPVSTEMTDRELVERCRHADAEAFEVLVTRHQQRALNVAFQLLRDREDAMEVAQDAFVRIYRSIGEFRGGCEFTTWLHYIVVNLARNKHRWWHRRGRHAMLSLDSPIATEDGEVSQQMAAPDPPPDAEAVNREFLQRLEQETASLPMSFREVLVLRNIENLSYEEIAVVLECSVGTVKSRIARAREALRERMQAHEP
jgi:RNA polymerase sigma-70 factor, ECF subfamily